MSDEQTPTDEPDKREGVEGDEANDNGGPTWQHERWSTSYPDSSRPDEEPDVPE